MTERKLHLDLMIVVLLLGVLVGGFWMTGTVADERTGALKTQITSLQQQQGQILEKLAELQNHITDLQRAHANQAAAPAPAAVPASEAPAKVAPGKK